MDRLNRKQCDQIAEYLDGGYALDVIAGCLRLPLDQVTEYADCYKQARREILGAT